MQTWWDTEELSTIEADPLMTDGAQMRSGLEHIAADDTVSIYLDEMSREPLLTPREETELARCMQRGSRAAKRLANTTCSPSDRVQLERQCQLAEEARARFIRANTRLVVSIAKKYVGHGLPLLDLIQEGNLGLIRAVEGFDYRQGCRFSTYGTWWIRQSIQRALTQQGRTIRIPVHMSARIRKVQKASEELEKQLGRRPAPCDIAEMVGIPPDEVRWLLKRAQRPISMERPTGEEQESELGELIEDHSLPTPPEAATQVFMVEELNRSLSTLDPREEQILRLRYGLVDGKSHTLEEVGEQLGLTRERVRQIERRALRKLRRAGRIQSLLGDL